VKAWRVALLGLGLCALGVTADAADVTTLLYASPYSPNHPFSRADITWIKWVEQQSGGSLHILPIWSGALLSSDQSLTELRHGVSDIGLITPIYVKGGEHLLRIQTGFYDGARSFEQQVAMYRCLAAASPEFNRELTGLKILAVQGGTLPGILTRNRELTSLNDLAGLRIRVPTELLGVLRDLGADPVNMPMGEVYSALAKGVIDGVIAPADTFKSLHFSEVAKYFYQLEVPRGAYPARAIGERRWLSLSARARAILEASTPIWEAALAQETKAAVAAGVAQGQHDGVHFLAASAADQQHFDELYERDAERNARSLSRYDIDGFDVFHYARQIADGISASGHVNCSAPPISP
jgi:TRAP-type C4-dicarboxylate transport system substrate-binding protein